MEEGSEEGLAEARYFGDEVLLVHPHLWRS